MPPCVELSACFLDGLPFSPDAPQFVDTIVERDPSSSLLPRFHMYMALNESYKAFAFSASKVLLLALCLHWFTSRK